MKDVKLIISIVLGMIIGCMGFFIGSVTGLNFTSKLLLAIFLWCLSFWVLEPIAPVLTGFLALAIISVLGMAPPSVVWSGFASNLTWFIFSALVLGMAWLKSGLADRISYLIILKFGKTYTRIFLSIFAIGITMTPVIPSIAARMSILTPIAIGILEALQEKPKSKFSGGVMMSVVMASLAPAMMTLTNAISAITAGVYENYSGIALTWPQWTYITWVPALCWTVIAIVVILVVFNPGKTVIDQTIQGKLQKIYDERGSMSRDEKKVLVISTVAFLFWVTEPFHGIASTYIIIFAMVAFFAPKIGVLKETALREVNFTTVFFISIAVSFGSILNYTGFDETLASAIGVLTHGFVGVPLLYVIYGLTFTFGMATNPSSAIATLGFPLMNYASLVGFQPLGLLLTLSFSSNWLIFPFEFASSLMVYGTGWITMKQWVKAGAFWSVISLLITPLATFLWWTQIGVL